MQPGTCKLIKTINGPIKWYFDWQLIVRFSLLTQLCPLPCHSETWNLHFISGIFFHFCLFLHFISGISFHFCLFLHFISGKILKSGFKVSPRFLGLGDFMQRVLMFYSSRPRDLVSTRWLVSVECAAYRSIRWQIMGKIHVAYRPIRYKKSRYFAVRPRYAVRCASIELSWKHTTISCVRIGRYRIGRCRVFWP
jgi:hypothetical protein